MITSSINTGAPNEKGRKKKIRAAWEPPFY
jgi:hypothetical protein